MRNPRPWRAPYEEAMGPEEAPDALVHAEPEGLADRPLRGTLAEREWLKSKVHDLHRAGLSFPLLKGVGSLPTFL